MATNSSTAKTLAAAQQPIASAVQSGKNTVQSALNNGLQKWGDTTAAMGRTPGLKPLPQNVVSVTSEDFKRYPNEVNALVKDKGAWTDMSLSGWKQKMWSFDGNMARYQGKDVHVFVGQDGLRTWGSYDPKAGKAGPGMNVTAHEMEVGKSVTFHGPGAQELPGAGKAVQTSMGVQPPPAAKPAVDAAAPRGPSALSKNLTRAGTALSAGGALAAGYDAVTHLPGQLQQVQQAAARHDWNALLDSGAQAAKTAATTVAATGDAVRSVTEAARVGALGTRAADVALHVGGETLAKGAGRFVAGANIVIAAADTYQAVHDWTDPNVSTGRKIGDTITAVGSIAAATNIPIVSQAGAAVSTVSSIVTGLFG